MLISQAIQGQHDKFVNACRNTGKDQIVGTAGKVKVETSVRMALLIGLVLMLILLLTVVSSISLLVSKRILMRQNAKHWKAMCA